MSKSNKWCCTVIYRDNSSGGTGQQVLTISAPGQDQAKAWGRDQFMSERWDDLDRGHIVFLACKAELEPQEAQLQLL